MWEDGTFSDPKCYCCNRDILTSSSLYFTSEISPVVYGVKVTVRETGQRPTIAIPTDGGRH